MMKLHIPAISALGLLMSLGTYAAAQEVEGAQYLSVPERCVMKITETPVAQKLNLSSAQSAALEHAVKTYLAESKKLETAKPAKDKDREACDRKFADACLGALNPEQKRTILKIGIPTIGMAALIDPAIYTRVGLTPIQVRKVKDICLDFEKKDQDVSAMIANAIIEIPEPKPGADRAAYDKKRMSVAAMYDGERNRIAREKIQDEKKLLALMTSAQQAKWLDLAGPVRTK